MSLADEDSNQMLGNGDLQLVDGDLLFMVRDFCFGAVESTSSLSRMQSLKGSPFFSLLRMPDDLCAGRTLLSRD